MACVAVLQISIISILQMNKLRFRRVKGLITVGRTEIYGLSHDKIHFLPVMPYYFRCGKHKQKKIKNQRRKQQIQIIFI